MWTALGIILGLISFVTLIGIVVGLAVGLIRKQWKVLKWSSIVLGLAFVLLIVVAIMGSGADESGSSRTAAQASSSTKNAKPQPTSTPSLTFEDFEANAGVIEYEELFRNNEQYESQDFYFEGEIVQVIEGRGDEYDFRVRVGKILDDEIIYLSGYRGQRLLEDDSIEFIGRSKGLHSYKAILGNRVTIPELESLVLRLVTNELTEGSSPPPVGKSRENPIQFGESGITNDGLTLSVMDVTEDAEQMILMENQFNDPAPDGSQFVMVRIRVTNDTSETQRFSSSGLKVVGHSNVEYDGYGCGVIPNPFESSRNMFEGGELSGNVCFSVEASDVDSLVMYDSNAYDSDDWVFFALR